MLTMVHGNNTTRNCVSSSYKAKCQWRQCEGFWKCKANTRSSYQISAKCTTFSLTFVLLIAWKILWRTVVHLSTGFSSLRPQTKTMPDLPGCSNTETFLSDNLSCSIMGRKVRDGLVWSILSYYEIRFVLCFTLNRITLDWIINSDCSQNGCQEKRKAQL